MKFDVFGRGLGLQIAITVACEMAFILFGTDSIFITQQPGIAANLAAE